VIDVDGAFVLPGGVDVHTHVALPFGDVSTLDDFDTASRAAALGGTTTFLEFAIPMANESPLQALQRRLSQSQGVTHVDYGFHGCVARVAGPEQLADIARMSRAGVPSVKVFTAYRDVVMLEFEEIRDVMAEAARVGSMVMVHAETEAVIDASLRQLEAEDRLHPRYHPVARPAAAELDAAMKILSLARATGCRVYLVHVTLPQIADAIVEARAGGVDAHGETCPHYLLLDETCYSSEHPELFVCSPPMRPPDVAQDLWSRLGKGLGGVHSDHCCFDTRLKQENEADLRGIPPGVPGIETRLPLMISEALAGRMEIPEVARLCATEPARLFGLPRKGAISPGYDADLVVVDPGGTTKVQGGLHMTTDYSPFDGWELRGRIDTVLSRGHVLVEGGRWTDEPPRGSFLRRL
jgi:dihydropyrimidinase